MEWVMRFIIGGVLVSAFALLGDMLRPKSFAGIFGAAPSVALATLGLALVSHPPYASLEAATMVMGAIALWIYSVVVCQLLMRFRWRALPASLAALVVWLAASLGLLAVRGAGM